MAAAGALLAIGGVLVSPAPALASPLGSPASASAVAGRRLIVVTWTAPTTPGGAIARYRATASPGGQTCDLPGPTFPNPLTCTINSLTAGTPYTVGVIACPNASTSDTTDCSPPTNANAVAPGPPAAPQKPTVAYQGDPNTMRVSWVPGNVGAGISAYSVTPSPAPLNPTGTCTGLVSSTSCDIGGLTSGVAYTFRVAAIGVTNAAGSSGSSTLSLASTAKIAGAPNVPDQPTVTRNTDTDVDVSWSRPSGGPVITGYTVTKTVDGVTTTACSTIDPDDTLCTAHGLNMAKSYTFAVKAVGDDQPDGGSSAASLASAPITPGSPGKPDAPSVELGDAAGKVNVYWDVPDGGTVDSYVVTPSPTTANLSPATCTVSTGPTQCAFQGLENGQAYTFTVTAHNAAGDKTSAPSAPIVSQLPSKPTTPTATLGDAVGKVNLTWPPATSGGTVTNYVVTVIPAGNGGNSATGTQDASCGANLAAPSCMITGLTASDSYTFTVTAVGDLGAVVSDQSAPIIPNKPGTPAVVGVTLAGSPTVATVTWTIPTSGGGVVTGYKVVVTSSDFGTIPSPCEVGPSVSHCDFPGLDGTKHYQFTVSAKNAAGETAASPTAPIVPSKPGAPTGVSVTITSPGHVTVGWTPPNGAAVSSYSVAATSTDQAASVSTGCSGGSGATSCQIGDLSNDKPYTFVVTATNILGSSNANPTPPIVAAAVQAPTAVVAQPGAVAGTATVSWTAPAAGGTVNDYTVMTATTDFGTLPLTNPCVVPAGTTTCTISGLEVAKHYNFTVTARGDLGSQPAAVTPDMVPDQPGIPTGVGVALKANTPGTVVVSWGVPVDRGAPTSFEVLTSTTDGGALPTTNPCVTGGNATSCEISGLNPANNYRFVVTAKNLAGHSDANATTALLPDKPGAPTAPQVTLGNANGKVTVSWTAPAGGAVTGYQVVAASTNGGTTTPTCSGGQGATSCAISGLDADKLYTFTVQASNAAGTSNSVPTGAIVPGPSPTPTNVQTQVGMAPGNVTVTWDEPAGAVVTTYTVTPIAGAVPGTPCTVTPPAPKICIFTNLDITKTYTFTVKAENALNGNTTAPTGPVIANKPNPPGPPHVEITGVDETGATVSVTWYPSPPGAGPVADYTVTAFATDAPATPVNVGGCNHVSGLTCNFGGLNVTKAYNFVVTANGSAGATSDGPASMLVDMAGPGAPEAPKVVLGGANGVMVSWAKPNTGGPVEGFTVKSSPAVETPAACIRSDRMSCLFTGLISGTSYTFTVTAEGTAGRTATSGSSAPIVVGPPDVPSRPTVAPGSASDQVVVSWESPSPGAGIGGYTVESIPGKIGCAVAADALTTSCVVSGLTPATTYAFRVQAVGVPGSGSSAFSRVSEPIVPQAPGRPYDIDVVAGNRQIAVSWTPPANAERVASYRAVASPGGANCTTTGTECIITGLTNLKSYTVSVVAVGVTNAGESPASLPSIRVRPSAGRPGTPTAVQVTPGDGKALVSWTAPAYVGDGIAKYAVTATGDSGSQGCLTDNGSTLSCIVSGLTNLAKYSVTVVSVGKAASGNSAPSAPIDLVPNVPPGTPTNVAVTPGDKTLVVSWAPGADGSGVSGVIATATGGATPLTCSTTGNAGTTCTINSVVPGTTYAVTVVANSVVPGVTSPPGATASAMALSAAAVALPINSVAPASAGTLTSSSTTAKVGDTLTITGTGYAPFTGIAVGIYPNGVPLATVATDSTGKFVATVKVSGVTAGSRVIAAGGVLSTGPGVKYKTVTVTVS